MIRLKIAVAFAIIKQKPPHLSGQEYAERLRALSLTRLQKRDRTCHDDDAETIPPSQVEETLINVSKECGKIPGTHTGLTQVKSKGSSEETASSCDKTAPKSSHVDTALVVSKACRKEVSVAGMADHEPELFEIENTRFMQSVICLNAVDLSPGAYKGDGMKSCIASVNNFRDILSRDIVTLPESCLRQATVAVIHVMDTWPWLSECEQFMKSLCDLIDLMLRKLTAVPSGTPNWMSLQRKKQSTMTMLLIFLRSKSTPLTTTILETLLEAWEDFCRGLRSSRSLGQPLDPAVFENSFFVIRCLERLAKQWSTSCTLHSFFLEETQERLEKSLLHLTDPFPLVAHAVWKVTASIEKALQDKRT